MSAVEGTHLLRNEIKVIKVKNMATKKKTRTKIDLLKVPNSERPKVIKEIKQSLRQAIIEAKLWNAFLQCETVTINGQAVLSSADSLNGFLMTEIG